jgi:hypothetical protein
VLHVRYGEDEASQPVDDPSNDGKRERKGENGSSRAKDLM